MFKLVKEDNKGVALVTVIMIMLVLSLLSVSALTMSTSNVKNGLEEREFQASYYIAEAGANYGVEYFTNRVTQNFDNNASELVPDILITEIEGINLDFDEQYGSESIADITIEVDDTTSPATYNIVSKGIVDGISRVVYKPITINTISSDEINLDYAVYSKDRIQMTDFANILGSVATGASSISKTNSESITGDEFYNVDKTYELPEFPEVSMQLANVEMVRIDGGLGDSDSASYGITLDNQVNYIDNIHIWDRQTVKIQYTESTNKLVIDQIHASESTEIKFEGDGPLEIYILGEMSLSHSNKFNHNFGHLSSDELHTARKEAAENLSIYYSGGSVNIPNADLFNASIYAKNADLHITDSGSLYGNFISGANSVHLSGSATVTGMIYAPKAHVNLTDAININGPVVSKALFMQNSTKINFTGDSLPIGDEFFESTSIIEIDEKPIREK